MRYGVLGPLTVWDGDGRPVTVPEAKVRALLADLLVHEGQPVSADRLVDDLWGGDLPGNPANALQAKVSQLRRVLGRDRVVRQIPGYRLHLDPAEDEVDADRFRSLVAAARAAADPGTRAELLTRALELWRGPAYADFADEEFVRAAAHRLAEQHLSVLEEQAEARLESGGHTLLIGELADLVARHPLRERLRAVQMRALYLVGRQSEALASYADIRERLADELGLDPGPGLAGLHDAILRQDPALSHTAPAEATPGPAPAPVRQADSPAPAPHRPPGNLPAALTALVGRTEPLSRIDHLLDGTRLVTLTGPGGVGKTRLAVAAAAQRAEAAGGGLPDGVWLVELAGQRGDTAALVGVVSAALGIRDDSPAGQPGLGTPAAPAERLAAALRDRRLLLVLDNCEQVVEAAAELAGLLLRCAPGLRVLATSQEPLGLDGEAVFLVEPLGPSDAVRLFAERAAAAAPGFTLDGADDADQAAVAEICRRLDGIPLALELAATRVRALGVAELAVRLGDRFRVLTAGRRGAPARQQTLRAMIDWSWDLLGAPERAVLRRLAVHADGCTLAAAEAVCAGGEVPGGEVLDLVGRLVDRSLVAVVDGPRGPRYRLLESVAAYATERLHETGDFADTQDRHLAYYLALAEEAAPHLHGPGQQEWLGRLDAEAANLRAALDTAVHRPETGEAARLGAALTWWWLLRGRLTEGRRTIAAVLDASPGDAELRVIGDAFVMLTGDRPAVGACPAADIPDPVRRGRALWLFAYALFNGGDPAGSEVLNTEALGLCTDAGDEWGVAAALALQAMHAFIRGDLDTLVASGLSSAGLFHGLGDRWGELQTVTPLAAHAEIKGDYREATRRQRDALGIARTLGLETEIAARLSGLGRLALLTGDWERARELHEEARLRAVAQGYVYGEVHADMGLALGARRSGALDEARTRLQRLIDRYGTISSASGQHLYQAESGFTAELRGDAGQALAHQLRGLEFAAEIGEPRAFALSFEGLAGAAALSADARRASFGAALLGAADAARRSVGAPLPEAERGDVDRITAALTALLGPGAFAEAFRGGAGLPPEKAADAAREFFAK
ncbi:BTAD domain-containing putative transcriptional regulator [Yinghuangia soli]|uniref:Winged helix-turn-helix domain-containing protein n=1 Tax=Yinghuangia soli TaxID=2908204 RepID=A0AA41Q7X3_9ACTN|nr:BTAD domain-containing putative transcriptional regulator [Yinghuangia soli]MCF2532882.1 winged helix-turn-helix domain-containing protein [Yinghuangia soli]